MSEYLFPSKQLSKSHHFLLVLSVLLGPAVPLAAQVQDTTPPEFASLLFTPDAIDTSGSPQEVTVTVGLTDDLSGVSRFTMYFVSPSGAQSVDLICFVGNPSCPTTSGGPLNGTFQLTLTFPQFSEEGTWNAFIDDVRDEAGNITSFSSALIQDSGYSTALEVSSTQDTAPPEFSSLIFTPGAIDTSASPQEVAVTVGMTDDLSGVSRFTMYFVSPSGAQSVDLICFVGNAGCPITSGDPLNGIFQLTLTFPQFSEEGAWNAFIDDVRDEAGNITSFSSALIQDSGFSTELEVGGTPNVLPAAIAAFSSNGLVGEVLTFDGTGSSDPDGTIASFDWGFGDGTTASGAIAYHGYEAVGSYPVTLTVTDDEGATASAEGTVTVVSISEGLQELVDLVASLNLQEGISNALDAKLQNVLDALAAANAGNRQDAAGKIEAFINAVEAQRGKKITDEQADALIAEASRILSVL